METTLALLTWFQTTEAGSAALQAAMGLTGAQVKAHIHHHMAPKDPPFPYLVHDIDDSGWPMALSEYLLDIWTFSNASPAVAKAQAIAIKAALKPLLNWSRITTAGGEVIDGRIGWRDGDFIATDNENVVHYATIWNVRYFAKAEVAETI